MDRRALLWPLLYLGLALVIAGPLLAPGYVFALDHALGPRAADYYASHLLQNEDAIQNKGAYALLLLALDSILPMWLAQKILLFAPFFLAGYGAHRLVERRVSAPAALFAGLLYALSPFAYVRGVAGQTGVLWAYAIAPWFLRAWLDGTPRGFAIAAALVAATLVFQAHGVVLLVILVGAIALARIIRAPRAWWPALRAPLALAAWSIALNAAWLVPVMLAPETTLSAIGAADREFFEMRAAGLPSVGLAALTLQGFWREGYASPYASPALLLVPLAVLLLSIHGLRTRDDDAARGVAVAAAIGLLLALTSNAPVFGDLWDKVPVLRGFRDAHKLLALLALAYAFLAPAGLDALLASLRGTRAPRLAAPLALAMLLAAPVATASPLLAGYDGQLGVAEYPDDWARVEEITRGCEGAMAVVPWHLYLDLSWLPNRDKRATDPAKLYFTCPTLTSDDLELGGAASQASSPTTRYVRHWLVDPSRNVTTLGNLLSPARVEYVLLLKEADHATYARYLDAQRDLRVVHDGPRARLYANDALIPAQREPVREEIPLATLDELVPLSEARPLAGIAFPLAQEAQGARMLYAPAPRAPMSAWEADGERALYQSLGFAPAFDADAEARVRDAHAALAILAWGVSAGALVALAALARLRDRSLPDRPDR